MLYGLYTSAGGMLVQRHRIDVIANNMANVNTTSFKRDVATLTTRRVESLRRADGLRYRRPPLDGLGGGTRVSPSTTEFAQGEIETTSRALDVCITGPGFFPVMNDDGTTCYTRDGRLTDQGGFLALLEGGRQVLDSTGRPIQVDSTRPTAIAPDGTVSQDGSPVGRIELVTFDQAKLLRKIGDNLYAAPAEAAPRPTPTVLLAGALERSTADPVKELTSMIEAQRAYEANAALIRLHDQTLGRVINDLPRNL